MSLERNLKDQYEVIGEFVSKVNSREFFVNILLEKIILKYSHVFDIQESAEYTIDHIETQSLKIRINLIIVFLAMSDTDDEKIQRAIVHLKDFVKWYNKYIRDIRDFIAHNPYVKSNDDLVVSSRRYKGKLNSIKIQDLRTHVTDLTPKIREISDLIYELSVIYPEEVTREFS